MNEIVGKKVEFKVKRLARSTGRTKEFVTNHIGKVKKVIGTTVIIEGVGDGLGGGLHSRALSDIVVLEVRK